jgi:serine/threonine protein kinase
MITEEMFNDLFRYSKTDLIYGKTLNRGANSEVYRGKKKAFNPNGTVTWLEYAIKVAEFQVEINEKVMADDLRDAFAPMFIQKMANSSDFLSFDRFYIKMHPRSSPTQPIIQFDMVVGFPAYGDSLDKDRPAEEFAAPIPKIQGRGLWDIDEFFGLRDFLIRCLATLQRLGVVHRDIKPANILKKKGSLKRTEFKLIDFDSSRLSMASHGTKQIGFTELWSRPDLTADVAKKASFEFWMENEQYCIGLTLLAIGCQLTPQEIQAAKTDQARQMEYLKALSELYKPESAQLVKDLLNGSYAFAAELPGPFPSPV